MDLTTERGGSISPHWERGGPLHIGERGGSLHTGVSGGYDPYLLFSVCIVLD